MSYTPATTARNHQNTALVRIAEHPGQTDAFALLMEMGTGKSKVVVDEWGYRLDDLRAGRVLRQLDHRCRAG
jgi:hypothetical protein